MADLKKALLGESAKYGIPLSPFQAEVLLRYLALLERKNEKINLTRITDSREGVYLHLLDSLFFVRTFAKLREEGLLEGETRFVDMGTGGGFPGVPFGVATGDSGVLLDSVAKKARAVEEMLEDLELSSAIKVEAKRTEEKAQEKPQAFNVALARALAPLEILVEYASPLLLTGGLLIASKAHPSQDELKAAEIAAPKAGMKHVSRETLELPENRGHREMFVFQKTCEPQIHLPRKMGTAQKRPLSTLFRS